MQRLAANNTVFSRYTTIQKVHFKLPRVHVAECKLNTMRNLAYIIPYLAILHFFYASLC